MGERRTGLGHRRKVSPEKRAFAQELRNRPSHAQERLWQELRGSKLGGRFRRRAVLYGWIPDFWCPATKLVIEIDHASDAERVEEHDHRDKTLWGYGIQVMRIGAQRVFDDLPAVLQEIRKALESPNE